MRSVSRRALLRLPPVIVGSAISGPLLAAQFGPTPEETALFHANKLAEAMNQINPGSWVVDVCPARDFALIHRTR